MRSMAVVMVIVVVVGIVAGQEQGPVNATCYANRECHALDQYCCTPICCPLSSYIVKDG